MLLEKKKLSNCFEIFIKYLYWQKTFVINADNCFCYLKIEFVKFDILTNVDKYSFFITQA